MSCYYKPYIFLKFYTATDLIYKRVLFGYWSFCNFAVPPIFLRSIQWKYIWKNLQEGTTVLVSVALKSSIPSWQATLGPYQLVKSVNWSLLIHSVSSSHALPCGGGVIILVLKILTGTFLSLDFRLASISEN